MFPFSNYCQIPQLNCIFEKLAIVPQRMILLVELTKSCLQLKRKNKHPSPGSISKPGMF